MQNVYLKPFTNDKLINEQYYLCFTAEEDNATISLTKYGNAPKIYLEYSSDNCKSWKTFVDDTLNIRNVITLQKAGEYVFIRAGENGNKGFGISSINYNQFNIKRKIAASGNIMSLLFKDAKDVLKIPSDYCFLYLFKNCQLTSAPELPAINLSRYCYYGMFEGCSSLTVAPELLATTLASSCYQWMFAYCSSLNTIKVNFQAFQPANATLQWLDTISSFGTFICPASLDTSTKGINYIPRNWNIVTF